MKTLKNKQLEDEDINDLYLESEAIKATRTAHTRTSKTTKIKVRSSLEKARDDYKRAKRLQRDNIRRARQQIKSYKLLKKQARTTYRIIKLAQK